MKFKYIFITTILFFCCNNCFSQDTLKRKQTSSIYYEFRGATYEGSSLNYERLFNDPTNNVLAFRIGGGINKYQNGSYYKGQYSTIFALPAELLFLFGKINVSFLEIGGGATPSFGDRFYLPDNGNTVHGSAPGPEFIHYNFDILAFLNLGYRYQSDINHIIFRIDFTDLFLSRFNNDEAQYETGLNKIWVGVSLGYCFSVMRSTWRSQLYKSPKL